MILNAAEVTRLVSEALAVQSWHPVAPKWESQNPNDVFFFQTDTLPKTNEWIPKMMSLGKGNSLYKHGNFWISMLDFRRITFGRFRVQLCCMFDCRKVCFSPTGVLSDVTFATWSVPPLWTCAETPLLTMHLSIILLHLLMTFPSPQLHHHYSRLSTIWKPHVFLRF